MKQKRSSGNDVHFALRKTAADAGALWHKNSIKWSSARLECVYW